MSTYGPAYDEHLDGARIKRQHETIRDLMLDGVPRTLPELAEKTGYPESSISAQLRHLRKTRFGAWNVMKERIGDSGLWAYWIQGRAMPGLSPTAEDSSTSPLLLAYLALERILIDARRASAAEQTLGALETISCLAWAELSVEEMEMLGTRTGSVDERNTIRVVNTRTTAKRAKA